MGTMPAYIPGIQGCPGPTGYGDDDGALHGRLRLIRGLVIPGDDDAKRPKAAFQEAVDDDPAHCEADDPKPDRPQKGSFNVQPCTGLHRCARRPGGSPLTAVSDALRRGPERGLPAASDQWSPTRLGGR